MKHKFLIAQAIFVVAVLFAVLVLYPKTGFEQEGNKVTFSPTGASVIVISEDENFNDARVLELDEKASFRLKPGTYYWKSRNGYFESLKKSFRIDSTVGLRLDKEEEGTELENVGDVKINVTKTKNGTFVGRIILEPEETEKVEDEGRYTGRETS